MKTQFLRKRDIFESLFVFSVMAGALLPARLLFVEYVSDSWISSVGIISAISISIIILAKKKKLGFFGPMLERQIFKLQKGKRGLAVVGESVFVLLILGGMIFAIDQGNTAYSDYKLGNVKNAPTSQSAAQILEQSNDWEVDDWINGFLVVPIAFLTQFPQMSAIIASIDESMDGWLMHFYTVDFVEYLEILGLITFYRISFRRKVTSPMVSKLYEKTAV